MKKFILDTAKHSMLSYFSSNFQLIYKRKELYNTFSTMRTEWNLSLSLSSNKFVKYLINEKIFNEVMFNFPNRKETRFVRGKINIYKILLAINKKGYFSHLSALHFHNLLLEKPKLIYWNVEQPKKNSNSIIKSQESITNSFKNKSRISNNVCEYEGYKIYGINGMHTGNLGVIKKNDICITDIERTLIDIVVRPQYSGGFQTVLNAFNKSKGKVNIEHLIKYYKTIKYLYPYHQSIGFYLEITGYPAKFIESFSNMKMEYDFYLDNQIRNPKHSKKWRLYYPSEFD